MSSFWVATDSQMPHVLHSAGHCGRWTTELGGPPMEYLGFRIENFKGISAQEIRFDKQPTGMAFALVGLNESGKTTVLEAISYLERREKNLESMYKEVFQHSDVHDLIPMKKKANFNESILITAKLSLSDFDKNDIVQYAKTRLSFKIDPGDLPSDFEIIREMQFKNSEYVGTRIKWTLVPYGKPPRGKKAKLLIRYDKEKWNQFITEVNSKIPSILYFPTFLFDFPSRIYVSEEEDESQANAYYRSIIKDILDSLDDGLDINQHIVDRARDGSRAAIRSLEAVLNKMGTAVSKTVFEMWNNMFDRNIPRKDIVIQCHTEDGENVKVYLEFSIKDGNAVYLVTERSLGFRWFFCFLLFTQFRRYRKERESTMFLFDEPASNLHSRAQAQLLRSFTKLTEGGNGKIMYSTHSHHMINPKWLENTYIVANGGVHDTEESEYEYSSRDTDIQILRYREFVNCHPNKQNYFQPILDTLDYAPSALEAISDAIFVEGKNDLYMIKYFDEVILENEESLPIIPGTGASALDPLISLYLGWGKKFIILLDDDEEGRKCRDRYIQEWNLAKSKVITLGAIATEWDGFKMENLLSGRDIENIGAKLGKMEGRISKKEIARFFQEKLNLRESNGISNEAKSAFQKLIATLKEKLDSE